MHDGTKDLKKEADRENFWKYQTGTNLTKGV